MSIVEKFEMYACVYAEKAKRWLSKKYKANDDLERAIADESEERALKALGEGADPNHVTQAGSTVLSRACFFLMPQVVEALIKNGARVDAKADKYGDTALHCLALSMPREDKQIRIGRMLLEKWANVDVKRRSFVSAYSQTPLGLCAGNGNAELARLLIAGGADVNFTDDEGKTPFFYAVENGRMEMVKLLLDCGADPQRLDYAECSAWAYVRGRANAEGYRQHVESLIEARALEKNLDSGALASRPAPRI